MPIEEMAPRPPSAAPHAVHPIACVKMEHSLSSTEIEDSSHDDDPLSSCRDSAVAVVAYLSSLARSAGPERPGRPGGFKRGKSPPVLTLAARGTCLEYKSHQQVESKAFLRSGGKGDHRDIKIRGHTQTVAYASDVGNAG